MSARFETKLGRLRPPRAPTVESTGEPTVAPALAHRDVPIGALSSEPSQSSPRASALDELRLKIANMMERSAPIVRASAPLIEGFESIETPEGPLTVRELTYCTSRTVGDVALHPAIDADPTLLALFALDPTLAAVDPKRALFLDTETTGLGGGTGSSAFLVGLAFFTGDAETGWSLKVEQLFLRTFAEERALLAHVARRIDEAELIVTYNGKSFDMPLIRDRCVMSRLARPSARPHLDLLHVARRIHGARLGSCSLANVERNILKYARKDDVAGADIANLYFHYLRTRDASALVPVVVHNEWDVLSMVALVGFYGESFDRAAHPMELASAATVAKRAGQLGIAESFATRSLNSGSGAYGHRALAEIARARGDKPSAVSHYENALRAALDRALTPLPEELRHELTKLYEHHTKAYELALQTLLEGTSELPERAEKRRSRLVRKLDAAAKKRVDGERARSKKKLI